MLNIDISNVAFWQTMLMNCTKVRATGAARLYFLTQPIRSLFSGIVAAVVILA